MPSVNCFAITRPGLATIAVLVTILWSLVLGTVANQRQAEYEAQRLHLGTGRSNIRTVSQPNPPEPSVGRHS